jgi:hypothetical protein
MGTLLASDYENDCAPTVHEKDRFLWVKVCAYIRRLAAVIASNLELHNTKALPCRRSRLVTDDMLALPYLCTS